MKKIVTRDSRQEPFKCSGEKILLGVLPFWLPLIPPLGISCLKSFLQRHGLLVKTFDANIEGEFKKIYDEYFHLLKENIPGNKSGNFFNIGHDVLENHLMAHLFYEDEEEYVKLVKILVSKNYLCNISTGKVLELNKTIERFYKKLENHFIGVLQKEQPTVLGLSVSWGNLPASLFVSQIAKENYPDIKTVMGGPIFSQSLNIGTSNMNRFLEKTPFIDKIIVGEGENLFLKYLNNELPESKRIYTLSDINEELIDISNVDIPDFSDFELHYYTYTAAYTSRSCPFQCSFCAEAVYWGKYRKKSAGHIFEEMVKIYQQHGSQLFLMCDSLLNPVITDIAKRFIKSDLSIYWDGYLRADKEVCSPENAILWRRGGFYRARLGVESGSQHVLELIGKKIGTTQIREAIFSLAAAGIKTTTYWVIGHPGETEADFQQTLDLLEELADNIYEAECNPFRYFPNSQVNSDHWAKKNRIPLYTEKVEDMLIVQTWVLDCEPSWEETLIRVNRFVEHCKRLGIPNPYSMNDILEADKRWKKLQKNAVPALVEFKSSETYLRECKNIEIINPSLVKMQHDGNWNFC